MTTIYRGAAVHDGTGAPPAHRDLVVVGGRIAPAGHTDPAARVVDVSGRDVIPGLIDCHTHVTLPHLDTLRLVNTPLSHRFLATGRTLARTLDLGVTTVRDAGGADAGIAMAVADGLVRGPRVRTAIAMISPTGGHADPWRLSGTEGRWLFPLYPGMPDPVADGPTGLRRVVRELVRAGADVIKVAVSGGISSPRDDPRHCQLRQDELTALVEEAGAAGLRVMAHAHGPAAITAAVRAGVASIEHGVFIDEEGIALMVEHGTFLVPTLTAARAFLTVAEAGAEAEPDLLLQAREAVSVHESNLRRAMEAGVRIAMGSDSGFSPHGRNLDELEALAQAGLDRAQVLRSATSAAAELLGAGHEIGTLRPGMRADFSIVRGDPLDFATLAGRVEAVHQDGVLVGGTEFNRFNRGNDNGNENTK
ncbi:amidohydrolase family protein [Streptosporangium sp. NPDC051022]|uniref:metal-dependent hydrolase family protein n=1 Tax=Streptosporangium sp. NPDC051022 TaxID=3155752 RepID=UPI00343D7720